MLSPESTLSRHSGKIFLTLGVASAVTALWLSRAYSLSATSWAADDIYLWGALLSLCALTLLVGIGAVRSERFRIAFGRSATLCVLLMLMSQWAGVRMAAVPLMPGVIIEMMAFGVHSGPLRWVGALWVGGVNTVLYGSIIALFLRISSREQGAKS
jgi:hypothetical protein